MLLPIDTFTGSKYTIINKSSYNLEIKFVYYNLSEGRIHIKKGESREFDMTRVGSRYVSPPDPNDEIIKFIFSDLDTNNYIKEIDNNYLFKLINYNYRQNLPNYEFIITDILLFNE
jgi:hypothetical protein